MLQVWCATNRAGRGRQGRRKGGEHQAARSCSCNRLGAAGSNELCASHLPPVPAARAVPNNSLPPRLPRLPTQASQALVEACQQPRPAAKKAAPKRPREEMWVEPRRSGRCERTSADWMGITLAAAAAAAEGIIARESLGLWKA